MRRDGCSVLPPSKRLSSGDKSLPSRCLQESGSRVAPYKGVTYQTTISSFWGLPTYSQNRRTLPFSWVVMFGGRTLTTGGTEREVVMVVVMECGGGCWGTYNRRLSF